MPEQDRSQILQEQVQSAMASGTQLNIRGGNTKAFYGNTGSGELLDVSGHSGVVSYEPSELVITARAGTRVSEIENVLAQHNQMLAFEPPQFGEAATIGGTIACNLSGPRRAYAGAARDFMLGCRMINGKAEILSFGGQVMKNVAGYDVSRLMTGALGTLGVLLDVSLKVLPKPEAEVTLQQVLPVNEALDRIRKLMRKSHPVSACSFDGKHFYLRLSGAATAVAQSQKEIGGDVLQNGAGLWRQIAEHELEFFSQRQNLWRISVPSGVSGLKLSGDWFYDWGGMQRWLVSDASPGEIRQAALAVGGHAVLFRGEAATEKFQPLTPGLMQLHRQLKQAFDPAGMFNPGRLYRDL